MRINIDSEFFGDKRIDFLSKLLGEDRFTTMGRIVTVWHYAYCKGDEVIAEKDVDIQAVLHGFSEKLIESNLAEKTDNGIRLRGVSDRIKWLRERREAGRRGGVASAKAKLKQSSSKTKQSSSKTKQDSSKINPLALAPALALSLKENSMSTKDGKPPLDRPAKSPVKALAKLWNERSGENTRKVKLETLTSNSKRYRWAKARLREFPDLGYWQGVIERVAKSDFLTGKNQNGWAADFEFLVRQESHVKIMEGKYDNKGGFSREKANCKFCADKGWILDENGYTLCGACDRHESVQMKNRQFNPKTVRGQP